MNNKQKNINKCQIQTIQEVQQINKVYQTIVWFSKIIIIVHHIIISKIKIIHKFNIILPSMIGKKLFKNVILYKIKI